MHCAHFSFDLLGPHKGFLNLTECAHVHEFRKILLTEFTVYLKIAVTPEWRSELEEKVLFLHIF